MAKTKKNTLGKLETELNRLTTNATETGRTVWLAGLGTVASLQEQGSSLFSDLVKKGEGFEGRNRKRLEKTVEGVAKPAKGMVETLERTVTRTVSGALERFDIPSKKEIQRLGDRMDALAKKIDAAA